MRSFDIALALAERGYAVFPLAEGKIPALAGGHKRATYDLDDVAMLWAEAGERARGVGICPGASRTPLIALDVDVKGPADGFASLARIDPLLAIDEPTQSTPSGGGHYLFRADHGNHRNTAGKLGAGLDTRGGHGYIVAYQLLPEVERLPEAPAWLLAAGAPATREKPEAEPPPPQMMNAAVELYLGNAPEAFEGHRNETAYRVAARLRNLGLDEVAVLERLLEWAAEKCHPPLSEDELAAVVTSAFRYSQEGVRADPLLKTAEFVERARAKVSPKLGLKIYRGNEIASIPPPDWLIDGLLIRNSLSLIIGEGGAHKSFLALDIALALTSGLPVLGGHWKPREAVQVLYVSGEGQADIARRIRAWCQHHKLVGIPDNLGLVIDQIQLTSPDDLGKLHEAAEHYPVIFIDTLARAIVGVDENDNSEMGQVVAALDSLRAKGATVVVVHHTARGGQTPRGASALQAAVDTIILARKTDKGESEVECTKQRSGEAFDPITMRAIPVDGTLVFQVASATTVKPRNDELVVELAVRDALRRLKPGERLERADIEELIRQTLALDDNDPRIRKLRASLARKHQAMGKLTVDGVTCRDGVYSRPALDGGRNGPQSESSLPAFEPDALSLTPGVPDAS